MNNIWIPLLTLCTICKSTLILISNAGRLLTALICEYMDWAQLNHTLKVYLPECNLVLRSSELSYSFLQKLLQEREGQQAYLLYTHCVLFHCLVLQPKDFWKAELKEFSSKNGYDLSRNGESGPVLLDVLEGFLKFEVRRMVLTFELLNYEKMQKQ